MNGAFNMSKKQEPLTFERWKIKHHCAEGRCKHPFYSNPICCRCRIFTKMVKEGKTPSCGCFYYDHTLDYKK